MQQTEMNDKSAIVRYFITLSYDGTRFHGWQNQPNGISVQQVLEDALSKLLRSHTTVVGAGRTDAGVHARMMVAHFDSDAVIDCEQMVYRLNRILPRDVSVSGVRQVPADMHARFSAVSRTYRYYVHIRKNPFLRHYSCEMHYDLDFPLMNQAGRILTEYTDFGSFCKSHSDAKTMRCQVSRAVWVEQSPGAWYFEIRANRFLRNMVRAVVGTLVEVGRHRLSLEDFRQVIETGSRSAAGESMPGHALFLEDVSYS